MPRQSVFDANHAIFGDGNNEWNNLHFGIILDVAWSKLRAQSENQVLRIRYPSSFLKLLLIGFAFATLPLLWAFINANIAFDKLAKQSELTISNAVETTRGARVLQEQLHLMERGIRQYFVLQDDALFIHYQQAHSKFDAATQQLQQLSSSHVQKAKLATLSKQSQHLNIEIVNAKNTNAAQLGFLDQFDLLSQQIEAIIIENNHMIDNASSQLRHDALKTDRKSVV